MPKTYTFRLTSEGIAELQKDLIALGDKGDAALHKLEAAAPGFGAAMQAAADKAEAARKKLEATTLQGLSDMAARLDGAVRQSEASAKSLHASLDPAVAAQQRYASGMATVSDALKRQAISEKEGTQIKKLLNQELARSVPLLGNYSSGIATTTRLLGGLGIALSLGTIASWGQRIEANTAALIDQAKQLQQTTDSLQAYRAEFQQSGSTAEAADKALGKVNETVGAAIDNIGNARRELAEWNVDWRDLAAARPEDRLALIVRGLLAIEDSGRRARAEQQLFSRTGKDVEGVMENLAGGIDRVVKKQRELGTIKTGADAQEMKESADKIALAWQQLEVKATPAVVLFTRALAGLFDIGNKVASIDWGKAGAAYGSVGGLPLPGMAAATAPLTYQPLPRNPDGSVKVFSFANKSAGTPGAGAAPSNYSAYLSGLQSEAQLATMSNQKRAESIELINAANAKLKDGLVSQGKITDFTGKQVISLGDALKILSPTEQAEVRRTAALKQAGEYADKLRTTYAKFLADLQEGARIAGLNAADRNSELAVIQAAQVLQKQRGVQEKDLVQTYAKAKAVLGEIKTAEVQAAAAAQARNALARDILQPLKDELSLAGLTRDARAEELEILRLKQQYGDSAVKMSEDELRNLMRQRDVMEGDDLIADMREKAQLATMSAEQAEREAAVLEAIHATHGNLRADQADQIRQITEARQMSERIVDTAQQVDDVIANWAATGKGSIGDIVDIFKQALAKMAAQALLDPIIIPMVSQIFGASGYGGGAAGGAMSMLSMGSGGGGGLGLVSNVASLGNSFGLLGGSGGGGLLSGLFGGGSLFTAGGVGTAATQAQILAASGLPASFSTAAASSGSLLGGLSTGNGLLGSFGGGFGGFLGGAGVGALASSLIFGNKNDASMGGMGGAAMGAAIGSIIPGVGTVLGGLIGGLAGGGLGSITGSSNQGAIANFNGDGLSSYLFKQGGGNNGQMATQAAQQVSAVISALKNQGVNVSLGNISGLSIGSDKSYVYGWDGMKEKLGGGEAGISAVVSSILNKILPSASGGTTEAQAVLSRYMQNGGINQSNLSQLSSDLGFANSLSSIDFGVKQLTQSEQVLKQINDQYQQLIDKAQELGLDTSKIEGARQGAIQSLIDDFNSGISSAIQQINDPMAAASAALSAQQAQRIKEATALGADLTEVYKLNAIETEQLTRAQQGQIGSNETLLSQAAQLAQQAADFNEDIRIKILGFSDPLAAALAAEDVAGKQRLDQAKALGADLVAVEKYNGLARKKIADDFAEQAQQQAQQLAEASSQALMGARAGLAGLVSSLTTGDASGASPEQQYFTLASQYNAAVRAAQANPTDPNAIGNFQAAASAFAPVAREFLGTSQSYGRIRDDIVNNAINLGGDLSDPSGIGRAMVAATSQGSGAIVDAIGQTNERIALLNSDFKSMAAVMQAIVSRMVAA